jgi:hypothetical protein
MKPNALTAQKAIKANAKHSNNIVFDNNTAKTFNQYTPAYVVSNENVHDVVQRFMPKYASSVLTVAASGDHPLICRLNGAKNITTFDISYNAKVIMDVKNAAIHQLNIGEYSQLLENLYHTQNVPSVPHMDQIVPRLKSTVRRYIQQTNGMRLFSNGYGPQSYARYAIMPSEYTKLQQMEQKPFKFIWSGIKDLDLHDNMYDFVHLSNVLDYVPYDDLTPIIKNIQNHVNIGGRIVILSMTSMSTKICLQYLIKRQINWKMLESGRLNVWERIR